MNAMTCQEVQEQLDLLAAEACDPPTRDALEHHLHQCPTCTASFAESQRLLGLLDLHYSAAGLPRLQQRIEQQARPRRLFSPIFQRAVAVAAMLLFTVGLIWLPQWDTDRRGAEPEFALLVHAGKVRFKLGAPQPARGVEKPALNRENGVRVVAVLPLEAPSGKDRRHELLKAQDAGKLPLPPAVFLELRLVNRSQRPIEVKLGDTAAQLALEFQGGGVVRIPVAGAPEPGFLQRQTLQLDPGKQHVIHIDRLVAGSRGKLQYIYLTEPGEYRLTPYLRLTAAGRVVTVTGETVLVRVGKEHAVPRE